MVQIPEIDEARSFLRQHGWLASTPAAFADTLLSHSTLQAVERGECVYELGEQPDGLYGVFSGSFAIEIAPHEKGPNLAHVTGPGFWFGEGELFDRRPRFASFIATRPSVCVHVPFDALTKLATDEPEIWRWIGLLTSQHLILALGVIDDASLRDPGTRVSALLLRLADARNPGVPREPQPEIDVTQEDLSLLTALSRATVAAHLYKLEDIGLISRAYRRLKLLDPDALRKRVAQQWRDV